LTAVSQKGQAAIIALLLIIGVGVTILVYTLASPAKLAIERDRKTAEALAQAKAALIGFAAGVDLGAGASRPGDLPCPDMDNDGDAESSCGNAAGTTGQSNRLGRLPWRTLGLPDLRDGNGERLWYAVSNNFKNNTRTICAAPGNSGCLNSDTRGTITVRDRNGTMINDGSNPDPYTPSGTIAVIIAPGQVLRRQGAGSSQDRSCTVGVNCDASEKCTTSPATLTPKCNPVNYLDVLSGTEDNAGFTDSSGTDGFINGNIFDASGSAVINDRLITITYGDLMPLLERRVAKEAFNCLVSYAAGSNNRYPWAAAMNLSAAGDYSSQQGERFGRIPDSFADTLLGLIPASGVLAPVVSSVCGLLPAVCMTNSWPTTAASPPCYITTGSWWLNWKEHVFYGVADAYRPNVTAVLLPPSVSVPAPTGCGNCLTVDPPSTADNKRFTVVVAGKILQAPIDAGGSPGTAQLPRTTVARKGDPANYLEHENGNNTGTSNIYSQQPTSTGFNDVLLYQQ
jgi:hypothetical protein